MFNQVILCCSDYSTEHYLTEDIKILNPKINMIIIHNLKDLLLRLQNNLAVTIYLDKLFLGFFLKDKINEIKAINPNVNLIFVEQGECPVYFGIRLHDSKCHAGY